MRQAAAKRGRGRPALAPSERRTVRVQVPMTEAEERAARAKAGPLPLAEWLRALAAAAP